MRNSTLRRFIPLALTFILILLFGSRARAENLLPVSIYLPFIGNGGSAPPACPSLLAESYSTLTVNPPPTDRPAETHPDLNLALRGYVPTNDYVGLVDLSGPADTRAPQLYRLFGDLRTPQFVGVFQVYDWNWATNSRGTPITDPPVTGLGMAVAKGEPIHVPGSGYTIGNAQQSPPPGLSFLDETVPADGYEALVLYASTERVTLKYTRDDNVVQGYTLHIEGICVEPRLLLLYQQMNASGRGQLPALRTGQAFATARDTAIGAAIRDSGQFMDPRSRKDWWQGR